MNKKFIDMLDNPVARKKIESARMSGTLYSCYTDGSCDNNYSKAGAYAYVLLKDKEIIRTFAEGVLGTTNNRMELLSIIEAIKATPDGATLIVNTDSQYCIYVTDGKPREKNADLINIYNRERTRLKDVLFNWIPGHSGIEYNELADNLSFEAYRTVCEKNNIDIPKRMMRVH